MIEDGTSKHFGLPIRSKENVQFFVGLVDDRLE